MCYATATLEKTVVTDRGKTKVVATFWKDHESLLPLKWLLWGLGVRSKSVIKLQ